VALSSEAQLDSYAAKTFSTNVHGFERATRKIANRSVTFMISIKVVMKILCGIFSTTSTNHYSKLTLTFRTALRDLFVGR
jgi:hypothetical protein